jgi:hypothetical protein
MVVGFDVCHDTRNRANSYGALVASLNKPFSRYFSAVSAHTSGEELSNYLTANIASELFVCFPCNSLIFRANQMPDGCSFHLCVLSSLMDATMVAVCLCISKGWIRCNGDTCEIVQILNNVSY